MSDRDRLREEHEQLQRAVLRSRREAQTGPVSEFVASMQAVMAEYLEARAGGMSRADAVKGIEAELRRVWPQQPSKFGPACAVCSDTGWREQTCWAELRCGRPRCATAHPGFEHTFVVRCDCPKGQPAPPAADDDVAATLRARAPKKRGVFSRFGGR